MKINGTILEGLLLKKKKKKKTKSGFSFCQYKSGFFFWGFIKCGFYIYTQTKMVFWACINRIYVKHSEFDSHIFNFKISTYRRIITQSYQYLFYLGTL